MILIPPFSYYGSKARVAGEIWNRFGDVYCFTDPFCGSLAVLLARPADHKQKGRIETVGDLDSYITNFWRAMKLEPKETAKWSFWPLNRLDLQARHNYLVRQRQHVFDNLAADPLWCDAQAAGFWVHGHNLFMGGSWCHPTKKPTNKYPYQKTWDGYRIYNQADLRKYFLILQDRLRNMQIISGDWTTTLAAGIEAIKKGNMDGTGAIKGLLLDPPYTRRANVNRDLYICDSDSVGDYCHDLAVLHGDDPTWRIALCGLEGEYDFPKGWTKFSWSNQGGGQKRHLERIWFSPHCIKPNSLKAVA